MSESKLIVKDPINELILNKTEDFIHITNWRLTADIYKYFNIVDKLYKDKKISKQRHQWLTSERPIELMKELIGNRENILNEGSND